MDRENVIKGLMEIVNFFDIMSTIESRCNELKQDAENAIVLLKEQEEQIKNRDESLEKAREEIKWLREMLKEQEVREPHYTTLKYITNGTEVIVQHPECPRCFENGLGLWDAEIERGQAYCKRCGQAVKWNG